MTGQPRIVVLRKRAEFLAVAAQGRKWATPGLILQKGTAHSEKSVIRYGLTTSKKVGNAVMRNRARRRLRALATDILPRHAMPGFDYVLIGRDATSARDFKALEQDLLTALRKLKVYRDQEA